LNGYFNILFRRRGRFCGDGWVLRHGAGANCRERQQGNQRERKAGAFDIHFSEWF
jgi:hypothetical protein